MVARRLIGAGLRLVERAMRAALPLVNAPLALLLRRRVRRGSVLHVSYMVHVPFHLVRELRLAGIDADYLAIGTSAHWDRADHVFKPHPLGPLRVLQELWLVWSLVARYEVVHAHFGYTVTATGWEVPLLRRLGRRRIVHFRGCEARDRARNVALHPKGNICEDCDHRPPICESDSARRRREDAARHADAILVTTPDMKDFLPAAEHLPFMVPRMPDPASAEPRRGRPFTIVHVTNQPGIEGTASIAATIDRLRRKGYDIDFRWLHGVPHHKVLAALAEADLAIGKMKMGYYANAQIESMAAGVPTVTHVRPGFMTPALERSGFIFATLDTLEVAIERCLRDPAFLAEKRRIARSSILELHDNRAIARRLGDLYRAAAAA